MFPHRLARRIAIGMLAGLVVGIVTSEVTYFFLRGGESRAPQVIELIIPPGTAERVKNGQQEPSLPGAMTFVVGDTLIVRNRDAAIHQLGPLLIPAGSSASLQLGTAQTLAATCTFQPDRYFDLEVQAPLTIQTRFLGVLQAGVPAGVLVILYGVFAFPSKKSEPE